MTRHFLRTVVLLLVAGVTACSPKPSETDQKVAELEKQLEATRQELAAKAAKAGEAASGAAQTAAEAKAAADEATHAASAAATKSAGNRATTERAAQAAADEAAKARAASERALADQQAATTRQADENERLRREMEAMKPRQYTVPMDTTLPVRTTAEISTKSMTTGATFDALLERDLVVDGTVLAKAGSPVMCFVSSSDPGGKVKGVASMAVRVRAITAADGKPVTVQTSSYSVEAESTQKKDATRTGIAAGAGAVIGAIAGGGKGAAIGAGVGAAGGAGVAMATRGDPAVIPTETLIEFRLSAPATIVLRP